MVVLMHDERLPESACRPQGPAHVIDPVQRLGSPVACRTIGDPGTQSLNDARALVRAGRSARGRGGASGAAGSAAWPRKRHAPRANATFRGCRSWTPCALIKEE